MITGHSTVLLHCRKNYILQIILQVRTLYVSVFSFEKYID